jgi:hypothetical protein
MLLTARILINVASVNVYTHADVAEFTEGDGPAIYLQLVDASVDKDKRPAGRRYVPAAGATLQVVVHNIDASKSVTRFATQPYAQDPSIWMLQLQATDPIKGTASLKLTLTEGVQVTRGIASNVISAQAQIQGR